jgi:hypothetical protein
VIGGTLAKLSVTRKIAERALDHVGDGNKKVDP